MPEMSRLMLGRGFESPSCGREDGGEVFGYRHRRPCRDVGASCVPERTAAGRRARSRDQGPEDLAEDLATVAVSNCVPEHREMSDDVGPGQRLAEDVGAFEVLPLLGGVARDASLVGSPVFGAPSEADRRGIAGFRLLR